MTSIFKYISTALAPCPLFLCFPCCCIGVFLPVIACMGGILSLKPKHYLASGHDVLHLSPHLSAMTEQQGYACCYPDGKNHGAKPLHFVVKVGSHGVTFFLTNGIYCSLSK